MKANIIGNGWAEFTIKCMDFDGIGGDPYNHKIKGTTVSETEHTVTVEYMWDGEKKLIVLEK